MSSSTLVHNGSCSTGLTPRKIINAVSILFKHILFSISDWVSQCAKGKCLCLQFLSNKIKWAFYVFKDYSHNTDFSWPTLPARIVASFLWLFGEHFWVIQSICLSIHCTFYWKSLSWPQIRSKVPEQVQWHHLSGDEWSARCVVSLLPLLRCVSASPLSSADGPSKCSSVPCRRP